MKNTAKKTGKIIIKSRRSTSGSKKSLSMQEWEKLVQEIRALNIRIPGNDALKFVHKNR